MALSQILQLLACLAEPDEYKRSIAADANTKLSHYTNVATATETLQPVINRFYGSADKEAWERHVNNTLSLEHLGAAGRPSNRSQAAGSSSAATPVQDDVDTHACTTHLSCARVEAKHTGKVNVYGVMGAVCVHGVPIPGSFVDLSAPEQYSIYLLSFKQTFPLIPNLQDVYVDFACRLEPSWKRFLNAQPQLVAQFPHIQDVRLLVNWMHANGHVMACQLESSGRFTEGAGRRIGENTEHHWSLSKVTVL